MTQFHDASTAPTLDENFVSDIVSRALKAGATDAEVRAHQRRSLSVEVRNGSVQAVSDAATQGLTLTTYVGKRKAALSTSAFTADAARELIERSVEIAKIAPEDAFCGLAPRNLVGSGTDVHLDLNDPEEPNADTLKARAIAAENAARGVKGVTVSESANAGWTSAAILHAASNGLSHRSCGSQFSIGVGVLAGDGSAKERGGSSRTARWNSDLASPEEVGTEAGERAAASVGARKVPTQNAAVIFEREVAGGLLHPMLRAIQGASVARGQSFLRGKLGERVFGLGFDLQEDPFMRRGLGSRAVDLEGLSPIARNIVEDGVLTTWLLDCPTARQMKTKSTAHAGGFYNVTVRPSSLTLADLRQEASRGLLVTNIFNPSLNPSTGDWSAGVSGFWFEAGEIAYPVSEVTVAGCLTDLYPSLVPGADLEMRSTLNSPSLLAPQMKIGGL